MTLFDRASGDLALAEGAIGPAVTRSAFRKFAKSFSRDEKSLRATSQQLGKRTYDVWVRFDGERLTHVTLIDTDPSNDGGWDSYSEKNEQRRRKHHDTFLKVQLGPPHEDDAAHLYKQWKFSWGTVCSAHDPRGGSTDIEIVYRAVRRRP